MKKLIVLIALAIFVTGCQHPLIGPADTFVNVTAGPYLEEMITKHEKDPLRAKLYRDNITAFRRAVKEAKRGE